MNDWTVKFWPGCQNYAHSSPTFVGNSFKIKYKKKTTVKMILGNKL